MSRKHYSTEFRDQVVKLFKSGRSASSLSREFGAGTQTILHWVHRDERDRDGEAIKNSPEYRRLYRELFCVQNSLRQSLPKFPDQLAAVEASLGPIPSSNSSSIDGLIRVEPSCLSFPSCLS